MSSGIIWINSHTVYQCNYSGTLKDMDGDVENDDVSNVNGSMEHNGFI